MAAVVTTPPRVPPAGRPTGRGPVETGPGTPERGLAGLPAGPRTVVTADSVLTRAGDPTRGPRARGPPPAGRAGRAAGAGGCLDGPGGRGGAAGVAVTAGLAVT